MPSPCAWPKRRALRIATARGEAAVPFVNDERTLVTAHVKAECGGLAIIEATSNRISSAERQS
jgi:hypothetical protein